MSKVDGVIEAVRYKSGRIDFVRMYERRGPAFSDRVLVDRPTLIARLQNGMRYVTGQRRELLAGTFEIGKVILLVPRNGDAVITTLDQRERDQLEGVPVV